MIVGFDDYKSKYNFDVTGVIHAGAHFGQEYQEYMDEFGQVETHWFEPIPVVFNQLSNNLEEKYGVSLYNFALGEEEKKVEINIDLGNDGQSSSILNPKEHINQFPHIEFLETNKTTIDVRRLDSFNIKNCNTLVIDTQGYELMVLKGSTNTLKNIKYIFIEFNTVEMYENCPSILDLDNFLEPLGFLRKETWYTPDNWGDAFYMKEDQKNEKLKLSVVVPAYKFSKYIKQCLDSILSQKTNFNFEVLVRDDFSCDGTNEILENIVLGNQNDKIEIRNFKSLENWGGFNNIKFLLNNCNGQYIAYIDGDDYFTDEYKLQKQVDFLDNNKEFSLHSTSCYYIKENGELVNPDWPYLDPSQEVVTINDLMEKNLISFGRMFRNIPNILEDSFLESNFLDYLINYKVLLYGNAKCDNWVSGAYRHTNHGEITKLQQSQIDYQNNIVKKIMIDNYNSFINSLFDGDKSIVDEIIRIKEKWSTTTILHNLSSTETINWLNIHFNKQIRISNSNELYRFVEECNDNTLFFIKNDESDIFKNLHIISKFKSQSVIIIDRSDNYKEIDYNTLKDCKKIFPNGFDYQYQSNNKVIITPKVKKKDVVIIDSFIFNSDIENKLLVQIDKFKSNGYDVILISNSTINTELMDRCDYFIYDSRNQLFRESYDNVEKVNFFTKYNNFTVCTFKPGLQRHGLSVLINLHNAVNFAKSLGYENFLRIEADDLFGEESVNFMKSVPELLKNDNKKSLLFYNDYENEYNISFHFMYFNIEHYLSKIIQLRDESDYQKYLVENFGNNEFQIAEKYIYNNLKLKGDSDVLSLDGHQFNKYFPDSLINTSTSLSNLESKYNGCVTTIYKNNKNENNVIVFSSNSTNNPIIRKINLVFENRVETIEHDLPYLGSWVYHVIDKNLLQIEVYENNSLLYIEKNSNLESYVEFD